MFQPAILAKLGGLIQDEVFNETILQVKCFTELLGGVYSCAKSVITQFITFEWSLFNYLSLLNTHFIFMCTTPVIRLNSRNCFFTFSNTLHADQSHGTHLLFSSFSSPNSSVYGSKTDHRGSPNTGQTTVLMRRSVPHLPVVSCVP